MNNIISPRQMSESLTVRPYRSSDAPFVRAIFKSSVLSLMSRKYTMQQLLVWSSAADDERFTETLRENATYVALKGRVIVGFADLDEKGTLQRLYVHPDFQRMGVATLLFRKLEKEARDMSIRELSLESSSDGIQFYLKMGFRLTGKRVITREQVPFLNYVMKKELA